MPTSPDQRRETLIYTDGSCLGNPGPGGWAAVLWRADGIVEELGGRKALTTNNQMEIQAAVSVLQSLEATKDPVRLITDSQYLVQGATSWLHAWRRSNWKTATGSDVSNQDLWRALASELEKFSALKWQHIPAHSGIAANERCDQIAQAFARGESPNLFRGPRAQYPIVLELPQNLSALAAQRSQRKAKAAFYLSLVGGKVERHDSWAACEARVKGVTGAKFRKATSDAEAATILASWGVATGK